MADETARGQSRIKDFKNVNKGKEEWRQRRNTSSSELRQNKRDHQISKRRHALLEDVPDSVSNGTAVDIKDLNTFIEMTQSQDVQDVQEGVKQIRMLMCVKKDPPIKQVVATNVHYRLVQLLGSSDYADIQFEAAWALTNIVSGDNEDTASVVQANAIPPLVQLLASPVEKVRAQGAWALGNIAGESVQYRDMVLSEGAMQLLLKLLWNAMESIDNNRSASSSDGSQQDNEILSTGTWAISNFVRGDKSGPNYYEMIEGAVPFLARVINFSDDRPTLADACWALSYLTDSDQHRIQVVVEAGVTSRLVKLMMYNDTPVVSPALRTIGNIVTGSDVQTTVVLKCDALDALDHLLVADNDMIRKESAWAMSNIFAGTESQIKKALEENEDRTPKYQIVSKLLNMMVVDKNPKARKEAAWAITNLITIGKPEDMHSVIYDYDGLNAIMSFLSADVITMGQLRAKGQLKSAETMEHLASNILTALLDKVLPAGAEMGYAYNIFTQRILEVSQTDVFDALAMLEVSPKMRKSKNPSLPQLAREIITRFFPDQADQASEYDNSNAGVNANGEMEFNPNFQAGGAGGIEL